MDPHIGKLRSTKIHIGESFDISHFGFEMPWNQYTTFWGRFDNFRKNGNTFQVLKCASLFEKINLTLFVSSDILASAFVFIKKHLSWGLSLRNEWPTKQINDFNWWNCIVGRLYRRRRKLVLFLRIYYNCEICFEICFFFWSCQSRWQS